MAHQLAQLLNYLGFVTWGDLGPLTLYRNKRGRMVFYPKAPPTSPPPPPSKSNATNGATPPRPGRTCNPTAAIAGSSQASAPPYS